MWIKSRDELYIENTSDSVSPSRRLGPLSLAWYPDLHSANSSDSPCGAILSQFVFLIPTGASASS